jgi:predicted transglutaminase-like cysteine proteinase
MSAKARVRSAAQWLPLLLFVGFVAASSIDTGATAANTIPAMADVSAGETISAAKGVKPERTSQPIIVASLAVTPPASNGATAPTAMSPLPASTNDSVQLALIDPTVTPEILTRGPGREPFGLSTVAAPDSIVWFKWRKVTDDIRAQEPALMRCLADETACAPAAARFATIVKEAREHEGRVRLNFVNQRVNHAIRYTSDITQWGIPDEWSAPLAAGKGSFETGLGDCEDYAIAKYVALRAAGVPAKQLRVLLVRDDMARLEHAVLTANEDGHWYVLDNRWTGAVEDNDVHRFTPLFALDDQGVKLLIAPYASRTEPKIEAVMSADQKLPASAETVQMQSVKNGIGALGLRPSIL